MEANYVHKDSTSLVQENKELKLELSGYRQAILEDKDMLGLKEQFEELRNDYIELARSEEQLQNNWNELKKWLGTRINTDKDYERNSHIKEKLQVEDYVIKQVMFFMQELEQGKDE